MVRILIVAFDGLQPSQISLERMPNVNRIADQGVRFLHNHCVFPSVTRANSASLVTGVTPGTHGLTANKSVFTDIDAEEVIDALVPQLPEINQQTDGNLLFVPTLGELIGSENMKWASAIGGTSGNAFVQHPNADKYGHLVIHTEFTNPPEHHGIIEERFGKWPPKEAPAAELVIRTADVAIEYALEQNPDVLMVWFPEPDTSQHAFGVDSAQAQEMYTLADEQLGRLLEAICEDDVTPDTFIVSDHGYSTIDEVIDVPAKLADAGFAVAGKSQSPEIIIAENGGAVLLYIPNETTGVGIRLIEWLVGQPWVGAIATDIDQGRSEEFTSLESLGLVGTRSPDIAVTLRSSSTGKSSPNSASGAAAGGQAGVGSHGGGSSAEMHNTLIAHGPSFKSGVNSDLPSGNIDVLPTILTLLGLHVPDHVQGRVLREALSNSETVPTNIQPALVEDGSSRLATFGNYSYLCEFG